MNANFALEDSHLSLATLSIVGTLLWLVYGHFRQEHSEDISLEHIGQNLTCDVGSLAAPQPAKLKRSLPVHPTLVISHPFRWTTPKKSMAVGHYRPLPTLTRD